MNRAAYGLKAGAIVAAMLATATLSVAVEAKPHKKAPPAPTLDCYDDKVALAHIDQCMAILKAAMDKAQKDEDRARQKTAASKARVDAARAKEADAQEKDRAAQAKADAAQRAADRAKADKNAALAKVMGD